MVTTPISQAALGQAVVVQPDGKIVVAGTSSDGSQATIAMARYTGTGSLDAGFGKSGVLTTLIGSGAWGSAATIQPDGRIIVAGQSLNGSQSTFAMVRYTITGSLDSSFGNGGIVTTAIGYDAEGFAVALQPDNKIVVAGYSAPRISRPPTFFALVRYKSNGSLDNGFGSSGVVTTLVGNGAYGEAVALDRDNKIVVGGYSDYGLGVNSTFALARYNSNGSLDSVFGSGGVVTTAIETTAAGSAVSIQSDNKIIVAGNSFDGVDNSYAVVQYIGDLSTYLPVILKE